MKILLTTLILFSALVTYADFLPQHSPPRVPPIFRCQDERLSIPESKILVQVYPDTPESLHPYIEVQRVDMNKPQVTLYSGGVTRSVARGATLFFGPRMKLQLGNEQNGVIRGQLTVEATENEEGLSLPLSCDVLYHIPAKPLVDASAAGSLNPEAYHLEDTQD